MLYQLLASDDPDGLCRLRGSLPPESEPGPEFVVLDQISIELATLADSFRDFPHTYGTYQDIVTVGRIFPKSFNRLFITNYQNFFENCKITLLYPSHYHLNRSQCVQRYRQTHAHSVG
jgi:hypothetical protein